jgi:hypothetical protein
MLPLIAWIAVPPSVSVQTSPAKPKPIILERKFEKGEKLTYRVRADLGIQTRAGELVTFIPQDEGIEYDFTIQVNGIKTDGIADAVYDRPIIKVILGETFDQPQKTVVEKVGTKYQMGISTINEVLNVNDLNPPKKKTNSLTLDRIHRATLAKRAQAMFDSFIDEVRRLSVFVGPLDTSLDLNPKFPLDAVVPGDTWKKTVGFQPQKLKGAGGKQAVQRLDVTYTFEGNAKRGQTEVRLVVATLKLDTDLSEFLNQEAEVTSEETGIKKFPLRLDATVKYDLDPVSGRTLGAEATSTGGFELVLTEDDSRPMVEEKFKGRTTLSLLKLEKVPPVKAKTKQ